MYSHLITVISDKVNPVFSSQIGIEYLGSYYILLEQIRVNLVGTELARAQAGTIRLKLLKIGAVILRNSRRIRFLLSSAYPYKRLFQEIAERLNPG